MASENSPRKTPPGSLNVRPDVIRMFHSRPFMTFEDVYDQLKETGNEKAIALLDEATRYSDTKEKQQAFAAGIIYVLGIQIVSREFDSLEASLQLNLSSTDADDGEDLPRSNGPGDDQPNA